MTPRNGSERPSSGQVERLECKRERILDHCADDREHREEGGLAPQRRALWHRVAGDFRFCCRPAHLIVGMNSGMSFDGFIFHLGLRFSTNALTPS